MSQDLLKLIYVFLRNQQIEALNSKSSRSSYGMTVPKTQDFINEVSAILWK